RDAVCGFRRAVAPKSLYRDELQRRPPEWSIPLASGCHGTRLQSPRLLEFWQVGDHPRSLFGTRDARPERIKGCKKGILPPSLVLEIVVVIEAVFRIPQEPVYALGASYPASAPDLRLGCDPQE